MYDQSFNYSSLNGMLRKSDFHKHKFLQIPGNKDAVLAEAVSIAADGFSTTTPLVKSLAGKHTIYRMTSFPAELVARKLNLNIRRLYRPKQPPRALVIPNVARLVSEGVKYGIYRLDIRKFYESFQPDDVLNRIESNRLLSLPTKRILRNVFSHYVAIGGEGIPRGLALSSTLSELMMRNFDDSIQRDDSVFFYSRYVDDIIVISSNLDTDRFTKTLKSMLPPGMEFNRKKMYLRPVNKAECNSAFVFDFEYLGYKFSVTNPPPGSKTRPFRMVNLDIADGKIKKAKTRIVRSVSDYCKSGDFDLLLLRFKFLTSNFSVFDSDRLQKKLAGIHYNYHLINPDESLALTDLDAFLRAAVLSGNGEIFSDFLTKTNPNERAKLLKCSFRRGFKEKIFVHFSPDNLHKIQECWRYA